MGKGDKKTRKGKIAMGSYGVSRPRKKNEDKQSQDEKPQDKKKETAS